MKNKKKVTFTIISLFEEACKTYPEYSILKRAQKNNHIVIKYINPRMFATDARRTVDDRPYGGGPGMVLMAEPLYKAVQKAKKQTKKEKTIIVLTSTRGKIFTSKTAKKLSEFDHIIIICGRYEGVDERIAKYVADQEISIGNFVLSGGELAALVILEAVSRYIPGVLGKTESLEDIKESYPVFTRPETLKIKNQVRKVPDVLLKGDHAAIEEWRKNHSQI